MILFKRTGIETTQYSTNPKLPDISGGNTNFVSNVSDQLPR